MAIASEAQLLSHCIAQGLKRPDAVTLAHIAFFEQLEGGIKIGGIVWRYRTVAEIGTATGYSVRHITRALASLDDQDLIERKVIWDPRKNGPYRVNGFRLTKTALKMLAEVGRQETERPYRKRHIGMADPDAKSALNASTRLSRTRHSGVNIYRGQDIERDTELFTLGPLQEERVFQLLSGEKPKKGNIHQYFAGYVKALTKAPHDSPQVVTAFWDCLEYALNLEKEESVEPLDPVVSRHVGDYLRLLARRNFAWLTPVEHGAIALWTYLNWFSFAALVSELKSKWPEGQRMNAWHLAKHGMLVVDRLFKAKRESENKEINSFQCPSSLDFTF